MKIRLIAFAVLVILVFALSFWAEVPLWAAAAIVLIGICVEWVRSTFGLWWWD